MKYAIKVSLSMTFAFLIPLWQGWEQATTGAITIMLIAATGGLKESISKGALRLIGTLIGAIVGMGLIALFPQERMLYLLALSICVTFTLYLLRAYQADTSALMLTAMTMMMVFSNGEVDEVFLYGIDKTYMTLFGIAVYTSVGVFIWPSNNNQTNKDDAQALLDTALLLFSNKEPTQCSVLQEQLIEKEEALTHSDSDVLGGVVTQHQWQLLIKEYQHITHLLTLISMHHTPSQILSHSTKEYETLHRQITTLLQALSDAVQSQKAIEIPPPITLSYDTNAMEELSYLERASCLSTLQELQKLHHTLSALAQKYNAIFSPLPTHFESEKSKKESTSWSNNFLWGDSEDIKGALITFLIFWVATYFWITFNPFGGFMVVALATGLSVLTTFTPLKPSLLIVVFTFSFIFAIAMYVGVLPHLRYGWELGVFIFLYSFIAFYFIPDKVTVLFLLGIFTLGISNVMHYHFDIFLLVLLMFYLFLILLHIFYYIPFSTKPEHLFLLTQKRFFRLSVDLMQKQPSTLYQKIRHHYAKQHLHTTAKKMHLWATQIDKGYFDTIDKTKLIEFSLGCQKFAYYLMLSNQHQQTLAQNPLIQTLYKNYDLPKLPALLAHYTKGKNYESLAPFWQQEEAILKQIETSLKQILEPIDIASHTQKDIVEFYEALALRRVVWELFFQVQNAIKQIDFTHLKRGRF